MQSVRTLGHSIYRITLLGGSPQRIAFSNRSMLTALLLLVVFSIAAQRLALQSGVLQIGVFLFSLLTGLYLALALLTRRVPRQRLRVAQLAAVWILAGSQFLLLLCAPLIRLLPEHSGWMQALPVSLILIPVLLGLNNCLRFALGKRSDRSILYTLLFALSVAGFYSLMVSLLGILFR
ncbi:MAG: hypothetical protein R3E82_22550 [Pseudomonadales bacterium]